MQHLSPDTPVERVAEVLAADGVCIVDDLAPAELLDRVEDELRPHIEATRPGPDDFSGHQTTRTGALIARSPASRELITNPLVLGAVGAVLGHSHGFQLHLTQVIGLGPGQPAQYIHRDQWAFDHFPFPQGYEVTCNTIWAMTDFTEENGATRVVPGSNHLEDRLTFTQADTEPAEMRRGSVVLYLGSLYHGGGENRSDHVRYGANLTYVVSWLRQEENQYLACPPEIARTLDDDLLRLMGYARGAYALGYVGDLLDPLHALRGTHPAEAARGF